MAEEKTEEKALSKKELRKLKEEQKRKEAQKKVGGLWQEFKKFITRGNIIDMSIGVVIGGAFGAIVTALTNIFLSICTWAVPGGLKGLVTILPPASSAQIGMDGIGQAFASSELDSIIAKLITDTKTAEMVRADILSKYTLHGSTYIFNGASIIDWGTFINAAISFIIIALVLFMIIKMVARLQKMRKEAHEKALEEYYKKHPSERPKPTPPGIPEPTDHEILKEILAALKRNEKADNKK